MIKRILCFFGAHDAVETTHQGWFSNVALVEKSCRRCDRVLYAYNYSVEPRNRTYTQLITRGDIPHERQ